MRPNFARLAALNDQLARRERPDLARNLRIVEALWQEAITLGVWPPEDPLEGLEVDLRLARVLNGLPDVRDAPPKQLTGALARSVIWELSELRDN